MVPHPERFEMLLTILAALSVLAFGVVGMYMHYNLGITSGADIAVPILLLIAEMMLIYFTDVRRK